MNRMMTLVLLVVMVLLLVVAGIGVLSMSHDLDDANAQIKTLLEVQPHYAAGSGVQLEWEGKSWVLKQDEPASEASQ